MPNMLTFTQMPEYQRYLLTGAAAVLLLGCFCRMLGKIMQPFAEWVSFTGKCISAVQTEHGTRLQVAFTDANRLHHTAVFLTDHPNAAGIQQGDAVKISLRAKAFVSGEYPDTTPEPMQTRSIYLAEEKKRLLRRAVLKELCFGLLSCLAAFTLFYLAMQKFF